MTLAASIFVALAMAALAQPPGHPDSLSESAKQLAIAKRYDEAAALWEKVLETSPAHFPSLFNLGYMRMSLAQYAQAEPLLQRAAKARPTDFGSHFLLGSALVNLGRREPGIMAWRTALELQPRNLKLMQILAVEYSKGGYFVEGCKIAHRALDLTKDDQNIWILAVKSCYDARDASAVELARDAVSRFPGSAQTNFEYGFQLNRIGKMEESAPYLEKAMAADPAYEEPFFFYGDLMLQQDRFEDAVRYLRTALKNKPDYVAACVSMAKALLGLERYPEALKELEACAATSPRHPQPHLFLSQVLFRMGDEDRARKEKDISLRLRREDPTTMEAPQSRPFPSK